MSQADEVSLIIRAIYDPTEEMVGIDIDPSPAFESGQNTRAMIEMLAAITAKANHLAAETIRQWDAPEERKKALVDHYAGLKEEMLAMMFEDEDAKESDG